VGATTGLQPALTLGCGSVGGSATSDNVGPMHLINIRRVAFGMKELSDIRGSNPAPDTGCTSACTCGENGSFASALSRAEIEAITKAVIDRLTRG